MSDASGTDTLWDDIASILSEDNMFTQQESKPSLMSPEWAMTRYPGKDEKSLRALAVALARDCVFGQEMMSQCTRSGRGTNNLRQTSWLISKIL